MTLMRRSGERCVASVVGCRCHFSTPRDAPSPALGGVSCWYTRVGYPSAVCTSAHPPTSTYMHPTTSTLHLMHPPQHLTPGSRARQQQTGGGAGPRASGRHQYSPHRVIRTGLQAIRDTGIYQLYSCTLTPSGHVVWVVSYSWPPVPRALDPLLVETDVSQILALVAIHPYPPHLSAALLMLLSENMWRRSTVVVGRGSRAGTRRVCIVPSSITCGWAYTPIHHVYAPVFIRRDGGVAQHVLSVVEISLQVPDPGPRLPVVGGQRYTHGPPPVGAHTVYEHYGHLAAR